MVCLTEGTLFKKRRELKNNKETKKYSAVISRKVIKLLTFFRYNIRM